MRMQAVCSFLFVLCFVLFFYVSSAYGDVGGGEKKARLDSVGNCLTKSIVWGAMYPTSYQLMPELIFLINEHQP
jgi:hypothetical protein